MPTHEVCLVRWRPELLQEGVHLSDGTVDRGVNPRTGQVERPSDYECLGRWRAGGEVWVRLRNVETMEHADFRLMDVGELSYRIRRTKRVQWERQAARTARERVRAARIAAGRAAAGNGRR